MRHLWPGTSGLVVLLAFTACGDRPTGPEDSGAEIAETPRAPLLSTRVFDVEPGPGSPGCFVYTVTLSDDTVSAPSDDEDPPVVDIFVKLLDDDRRTSPILDSVHVDLGPRIAGPAPGPIGIPLAGQIPPEYVWFFTVRDNPGEFQLPWVLGTFTDANGEIHIPYQTAGVPGIDSLFLLPYLIDGPAGPGLDFEIVTIDSLPPSLSCEPTEVTRGDEVTCTVSGTSVEVQGWEFSGKKPKVSIIRQSGVTERTWLGPAVHGGTVVASVIIDDEEEELETVFEVAERTGADWTWGDPETWSFEPDKPRAGWPFPVQGVDQIWGINYCVGPCGIEGEFGRRVQPDILEDPDGGFDVAEVPGGPNSGLWYVTDVSYRMDRASSVNPHILPDGDALAEPREFTIRDPGQAQSCRGDLGMPAADTLVVTFYAFNKFCGGVDVDEMIVGIAHHEGFGSNGDNGHESKGRAEAAREKNNPYLYLEAQIDESGAELVDRVQPKLLHVQNKTADKDGHPINGNWQGNIYWYDIDLEAFVYRNQPLRF